MIIMSKKETIVRAIITKSGSMLLCRSFEEGHYFLPGGHIEDGETPQEALDRELQEEIGVPVVKKDFITEVENSFVQQGQVKEEVFYVYKAELASMEEVRSWEDHIAYEWIPITDLRKVDFKPQKFLSEIERLITDQ